jgi:hypothetical protein
MTTIKNIYELVFHFIFAKREIKNQDGFLIISSLPPVKQ